MKMQIIESTLSYSNGFEKTECVGKNILIMVKLRKCLLNEITPLVYNGSGLYVVGDLNHKC
jgi:hypothetical protein